MNELDEDFNLDKADDIDQASFVCEDCDYRWEDGAGDEAESDGQVCPMCGSTNVTQL